MNWLEICVSVDVEGVEAVGALFREHVHGGVMIEEDITFFSDQEYQVNVDKPVNVKGYLPLHDETTAASSLEKVRRIEEALWHLGLLRPVGPLQTKEVAEEDWQESWKQFFHVHRIGRRIVVRPSWQRYVAAPGDVVVDVDPGMAFGTGLHPTTQMCLIELEERTAPGISVLDLGTGSGILAIAAAKLGADRVLALDVDPMAVGVARKNVDLNRIGHSVQVLEGSLPLGRGSAEDSLAWHIEDDSQDGRVHFDLVVANIIASVIADLSGEIEQVLRPSGLLIASGILAEKVKEVEERLAASGLELASRREVGDWVALVARKTQAH